MFVHVCFLFCLLHCLSIVTVRSGFTVWQTKCQIHWGSCGCRPNTKKNGEWPVPGWTLVLYTYHNWRMWSSHFQGCSPNAVESIASKVRLKLSTNPSDWGWYGVVLIFFLICKGLKLLLVQMTRTGGPGQNATVQVMKNKTKQKQLIHQLISYLYGFLVWQCTCFCILREIIRHH